MAPPESDRPSREAVYALCADDDRRQLLSRLDPGDRISVAELTRELLDRNREDPIDELDRDERRRLRIALVHDHLPRLADHDVVEYEPREREVVATERIERARPPAVHAEREAEAD